MDDRRPGCTLTINFDVNMSCDLSIVIPWLKRQSGLSQAYLQKILSVKMVRTLAIRFDSSANCFEAMQQITDKTGIRYSQHGFDFAARVKGMSCPCGKFYSVTRLSSLTETYISMKATRTELSEYGIVLKMQRVRVESVCTGDIQAIMMLDTESKLLNPRWVDLNRARIKVEDFLPSPSFRIDELIVLDLWNNNGFGNKADAEEKLEIIDDDEIITIIDLID